MCPFSTKKRRAERTSPGPGARVHREGFRHAPSGLKDEPSGWRSERRDHRHKTYMWKLRGRDLPYTSLLVDVSSLEVDSVVSSGMYSYNMYWEESTSKQNSFLGVDSSGSTSFFDSFGSSSSSSPRSWSFEVTKIIEGRIYKVVEVWRALSS